MITYLHTGIWVMTVIFFQYASQNQQISVASQVKCAAYTTFSISNPNLRSNKLSKHVSFRILLWRSIKHSKHDVFLSGPKRDRNLEKPEKTNEAPLLESDRGGTVCLWIFEDHVRLGRRRGGEVTKWPGSNSGPRCRGPIWDRKRGKGIFFLRCLLFWEIRRFTWTFWDPQKWFFLLFKLSRWRSQSDVIQGLLQYPKRCAHSQSTE